MQETKVNVINKEQKHGFCLLTIEKPAGFLHIPGQYTTLRGTNDNTPRYFAVYSPPEQPTLTFLIKETTENPDWPVTDSIFAGQVMGKGFPEPLLRDKHIIIITHGSGYSAFHGLLTSLSQAKQYKSLVLYYSTWNEDTSMVDKQIAEKIPDMKIYITYTQRENRIQKMLEEHFLQIESAVVLLAGSNQFINDISAYLKEKGYSKEQILTNF